ncbi:unnamed protein product [Miscanthus lutarioriparius]|uniref:Uncharacterized protein n=1 Tax=Miscanthus lutarioriparius TaxID=422564 RepID=A0A811PR71_9POAL|nr:unnamed protein product [Miscanthus lutarioriparius]
MAGKEKEGPMKNFREAGWMPPCSSSRHTPTEEESDLVYGGLRPCTGGHTPMEEEKEVDLVYDGLRPCVGRHMLVKQDDHDKVKGSVIAAERKADYSQIAAAGAASDEKPAEATSGGDVQQAPEMKWVEMPLEYIAWLLAQKREEGLIPEIMATDEAGKEEFFAFQEWVRETFDQNGTEECNVYT